MSVAGAITTRVPLAPYRETSRNTLGAVALGHPIAQLTAGLLLPWRLGVGARVQVPLGHVLELDGAYVYGIGVDRPREDGQDDFEPTDSATAWLGVGARIGR